MKAKKVVDKAEAQAPMTPKERIAVMKAKKVADEAEAQTPMTPKERIAVLSAAICEAKERLAANVRALDVDQMFTYHAPNEDQVDRLKQVREAAKALAHTIIGCSPRSADQSAAIRLLREAVMTANAAIVLEGKVSR